jgi:hypothetical protein
VVSNYREPASHIRAVFAQASRDTAANCQWLPKPTPLEMANEIGDHPNTNFGVFSHVARA